MARPIWKGTISFGLVNVPVTLYSGERRSELHFNLVDNRNKARVRYQRVNEVTGEEVPWNEIVKAFEYEEGNYIVLTDEDFQHADAEATQTVEIEDFVERNAVDSRYFDKPYFMVPGRKAEKGYVLLRETLKRSGKIGIAKVVIRTRQYLAAVVPEGNALTLNLLRFEHEVVDPAEFDLPEAPITEYRVSEKELDIARELVESMAGPWKPDKYKDDYREALLAWIDKKAQEGQEVALASVEEAPQPKTGQIVDFMSLLKQSLEKTQRERGAPSPKSSKPKTESPKRRTGGRKS